MHTHWQRRLHSQHFGYECNSKWLRVASSQRSVLHGNGPRCCCGLQIPAAREPSNGGKVCWQGVKVTDRSQFSSAVIPNRSGTNPLNRHLQFHCGVITLVSSPHLSSPLYRSRDSLPARTATKRRPRFQNGLYASRIQTVINVHTPGCHKRCSSDVLINAFYFFYAPNTAWGCAAFRGGLIKCFSETSSGLIIVGTAEASHECCIWNGLYSWKPSQWPRLAPRCSSGSPGASAPLSSTAWACLLLLRSGRFILTQKY